LGNLFNVSLGNPNDSGSGTGLDGSMGTVGSGCYGTTPHCFTVTGPFSNTQDFGYWTATDYVVDLTRAWLFYTDIGFQSVFNKTNGDFSVWPVRSGQSVANIIDAIDIDFSANPVDSVAGGIAGDVTANVTLGGVAVNDADITITVVNDGGLTGVTIDATGNLIVPAGTAGGTYIVNYMVCEIAMPTNCDSANATVLVKYAAPVAVPALSNTMLLMLLLSLLAIAGLRIRANKM
jgi:hypothetical protein